MNVFHHTDSIDYSLIPVLETPRLILRSYNRADLEPLVSIWSDAETTRFIGNRTRSRQEVWQQMLRSIGNWAMLGFGYWAVTDKQSGDLIGEAGFMEAFRDIQPGFIGTPEAGWVLARPYWRQGFANEILEVMNRWSDANLGTKRTVCIIHPEHVASLNLARKHGYHPVYEALLGEAPVCVLERFKS